jgi:Recombinase
MRQLQASGVTSSKEPADALNARGIRTVRGGQWHASTVLNVLKRAVELQDETIGGRRTLEKSHDII